MEAIAHNDSRDIRAHGGLLSILISNVVKVILAKHKLGTYEEAEAGMDLALIMEKIAEEEGKKGKRTLKLPVIVDVVTGDVLLPEPKSSLLARKNLKPS